ncbi:MAG: four helix bundle protein [Candidatus Omnitrophota bacterium]
MKNSFQKARSIRDLHIWNKSMRLTKNIYAVTSQFPNHELYGITSQMRRAVISIPSNIAEGFKRNYGKEFKRFLHIGRGSLAELETQVVLSSDLGYLNPSTAEILVAEIDELNRMIYKLIKKLN